MGAKGGFDVSLFSPKKRINFVSPANLKCQFPDTRGDQNEERGVEENEKGIAVVHHFYEVSTRFLSKIQIQFSRSSARSSARSSGGRGISLFLFWSR